LQQRADRPSDAAGRDAHAASGADGDARRFELRAHSAGAVARARTAGHVEHLARELGDLFDVARVLIAPRIGRIQPVDVRQQHQALCADHLRHARRETIVVAVPQLLRRDGIVLVDDRHSAVTEKRPQRLARVQVTFAALAVVERQQHLRSR
jgi:hypothetical protein